MSDWQEEIQKGNFNWHADMRRNEIWENLAKVSGMEVAGVQAQYLFTLIMLLMDLRDDIADLKEEVANLKPKTKGKVVPIEPLE
jgi:hypothetical protein